MKNETFVGTFAEKHARRNHRPVKQYSPRKMKRIIKRELKKPHSTLLEGLGPSPFVWADK